MKLGSKVVQSVRYSYAVNVTTSAVTEIVSALAHDVRSVVINDTSGTTIDLMVGPAGSEAVGAQIFPSQASTNIPLYLNKGMRIGLKAVGANATSGICIIDFYY